MHLKHQLQHQLKHQLKHQLIDLLHMLEMLP
jgi:hypothetical protein